MSSHSAWALLGVLTAALIGAPAAWADHAICRAGEGDQDDDGVCDSVDYDRDGDGIENACDAAPTTPDKAPAPDFDGDGWCDLQDSDDDGDGVVDDCDRNPRSPTWSDGLLDYVIASARRCARVQVPPLGDWT